MQHWVRIGWFSLLLPLVGCDTPPAEDETPPVDAAAEAAIVAEVVADAKAVFAAAPGNATNATAVATPTATVEATIEPAAFDLETVTFLVKKGKSKDAKALEKQINDPKQQINNIDVDGDGKVDKIQVIEVRGDNDAIVFEFRAIPSTSKDKDAAVVIATISFTPDTTTKVLIVKAAYAPVVIDHTTVVYDYTVPIEVKGETIVVVDRSPFYGWVYAPARPVYYGVYVYDAPPPAVIVIEGGCWPPGHCKHYKHHKKGKKHGKHHGKGKGKVYWY